jgi:glycogen debranching enzyme
MSSPNASPWVLAGQPSSLGDPSSLVTLVDGQTFSLSSRTGDYDTNPTHGVFFADMRVLNLARLRLDGHSVEPLAVHESSANSATFVGRHIPPGQPDVHLLVVRRRWVGTVWHELLELRNYGTASARIVVDLEVAADFADVFEIKEGHDNGEGEHSVAVGPHSLAFGWRHGAINRRAELTVDADSVQTSRNGFQWTVELAPGGTWRTHADLAVAIGERWIERRHHHPNAVGATQRNDDWIAAAPRVRTNDPRLAEAYATSVADLASLRLHDPTGRHRPVVAAGAPWYMTLFGRDALITAYMALPIDRDMALGVLEVLAELQGVDTDHATEEQPGRIVHETRQLGLDGISLTRHGLYYGSADATPLFVVLLGELMRWGIADDKLRGLVAHADRALQWVTDHGDRDGDGYVEYLRSSDIGLVNQGWKDSVDGIRYRDGRVAEAPLALCEVQGYVYAAWEARAAIADHLGEPDVAARCRGNAADLKRRFNRDFWVEELGSFAVALGPHKEHVDSLTSNVGHCLWSGIVDEDRAQSVADRLMSPAMWSGWGIRTLAADEPGFDPMSYHCGTVWPHDGAICAAGLARYGMMQEALTVSDGLLATSEAWHGRLPEFFCGFDRRDIATPVPFPTSCSPQAWAAATPLLLIRMLLGLEPDGSGGLTVNPIEGGVDELSVAGITCGDRVYDVRVANGSASVTAR